MTLDIHKLPGNLFDGIVVVVLLVGVLRGRKHGMSEELISLIKWLMVVVVAPSCINPRDSGSPNLAYSACTGHLFLHIRRSGGDTFCVRILQTPLWRQGGWE